MRVAILQAAAVDESLAMCDVAGVLRARGHAIRLFLDDQERDFAGAIAGWRPDVALVQAAYMGERWTRTAVALLPPHVTSVLVGTAATFDGELLDRVGAWGALMGELDDCAPALLAALERGTSLHEVPALQWRDGERLHSNAWGEPPDLDALPLPDRGLYYERYPFLGRFPWKRFATGRGCVHSCGFCYLPPLRDGYGGERATVRRKSVDRVITEIQAVRTRWPLERIHFADDLFAPSRPWLEELAERYPREVGIPFTCNTSPETVTEVNADLLARAGARVVGIGLETGSEANRDALLGRPTKDEAIRRAAQRLKARGVQLLTFNMLANPGEGFDDALSTLALNQELGTDFPRVNLAYPAPDSYLERLMSERGMEPIQPDAHSREEWKAWCAEGDPVPFEVLQRLFRLATRNKVSPGLVAALAKALPTSRWLSPLALYDASVEARWSGVSLIDGLRYARHAGKPNRRVTYHESLP
ncbi:MAG: radical SAM protein [Deltaproteobacteria bacterium]|nr:radical SAM protein [Deltaproteobacteria bacterium]